MAGFKKATRHVWYGKDGLVAGYVTQSTNLTRVILTNAGHMSPGYVLPILGVDFQRCATSCLNDDGEFREWPRI
jgi:hypothetical protein